MSERGFRFDVRGNADHRVARSDHGGEHRLNLLRKVIFHLLTVAHLRRSAAEHWVLLQLLRERAASIVDDGNLIGPSAPA
jgi:hypothetical protein